MATVYPTVNLRTGPGTRTGVGQVQTALKSSGLTVGVRFPGNSPDDVIEAMLAAQIEAAADWNTWWFLDQWERGLDPPCCAGCAGLKYVPDKQAASSTIDVAPNVLAAGRASCGPAVAYSLGHERAAWIAGGGTYEQARERYRLQLEQTRPRYWHATMIGPDGKVDDVTGEMRK